MGLTTPVDAAAQQPDPVAGAATAVRRRGATVQGMVTSLDEPNCSALRGGLAQAAERLAPGGDDSHPHLISLRDDLRSLLSAPAEGVSAASYDALLARLVEFGERCRQATVARDEWLAHGAHGPDPSTSYARGDLLHSHEAAAALRRGKTLATGIPCDDDYSMYTRAGDVAVHAQIVALAALITRNEIRPSSLGETVAAHVAAIAPAHPEVHDTEPEEEIVARLNPLLTRHGYRTISRDDLD